MTTAVLSLDHITVRYSPRALSANVETIAVRDVSLEIFPGETVGIVGESGSGKSTLGRVSLGLLRPTSGTVRINGLPFDGHRGRLRGRLGLVGQHPEWSLNPTLRVSSSVGEPLEIATMGLSRTERIDRVAHAVTRVGLGVNLLSRYPHELSGGQRQRVAIARALITEPLLIVFDEVVSALDVSVQAQVLNLIHDLQQEQPFAAMFISHDMSVVRYVANRVAVMKDGAIIESAPTHVFYDRPEDPYSRMLVASIGDDVPGSTPGSLGR